MEQNYQTSKLPTVAAQSPSVAGAPWLNPNRIKVDDGSYATLAFVAGGDSNARITGSSFGFSLPPGVVVDGVSVYIDGSQSSCYGTVGLNITGSTPKSLGTLSGTYGGSTDLWGLARITAADILSIAVNVVAGDISGGDGTAQIDYIQLTVYWHIDLEVPPADVPTRFAYKVYSRAHTYLGELPNVNSKFGFTQDINSAAASLQVTCGSSISNAEGFDQLLAENGTGLITEDDLPIFATFQQEIIALGSSPDEVLYKNSNRVKVYMYNHWYPNGKLMFSGQINKVTFQYGGNDSGVQLLIYSDGMDMANYIARGYPFSYTTDVSQTVQNGFVTVVGDSYSGAWERYGQTLTTGAAVTNAGAISLMLQGTATVTVSLYDAPNGNLVGSVTKNVSQATPAVEQFEFAQLLTVPSSTSRFFAIAVAPGQSIDVYRNSTSVYSGGTAYLSSYSGTGGGSYSTTAGDLYFITKYGTPTTTTSYTSKDPVTDMMSDTLLDYNARGGLIKRRNFQATGLAVSYMFNMATVEDVQKKVLELSPTGYYSYVDLGTAQMDMLPASETADFTLARGKDNNQLTLSLSIEQVKNNFYLTGGDTGGGTNLFRLYTDAKSGALYGLRSANKTDNRITLDATADAIGQTFIEENADEIQETTVTVLNTAFDITLLTPGKTIGLRNYGSFIDTMILQIVRRAFTAESVTLTLGHLPVILLADIQRINRDLMNEQTINNPTQPS